MKTYILVIGVLAVTLSFLWYVNNDIKLTGWEVVSEESREVYILSLSNNGIPFVEETDHLGRKWIMVEGYSVDELDVLLVEYREWQCSIMKEAEVVNYDDYCS